jgi:hypothetical protein
MPVSGGGEVCYCVFKTSAAAAEEKEEEEF